MRQVALGVSLVTFVLSLVAVGALRRRRRPTIQFVERHAWLPDFGISYHVGVDGISLLLVVLTTFLTPIALLCSWESVEERVREFSFFMLALEAAMIGVFVSLDLFLFYLFWDAMLIPMYFLIGIWGYDRRIYAAIKFMLYTMAGSVLMLAGHHLDRLLPPGRSRACRASTSSISTALDIPGGVQTWLFLAFAVAFAIKVPLFPFHTWLPDAHVQAPTAGSVILAGVLLKMGTYGLLRFAFPLFPEAALCVRAVDRDARRHRHRVRRARGDGAAGHEEARRLLVGEPPGLRRARAVRAQRQRRAGRGVPDARARHLHRRALPHRRHAVRSPAHASDRGVRRPQGRHAASSSRRSCSSRSRRSPCPA